MITTNKPAIDWLTVTTFDNAVGNRWLNEAWELYTVGDGQSAKIQQYTGWRVGINGGGSLFVGHGEQKGTSHYMLVVTGAAAEHVFEEVRGDVACCKARVSRIDLQVTIEEPEGWSQVGLFAECEMAGYKPEMRRSGRSESDGELITVYIGTRASGRFTRVYQKEAEGGEIFVRYEVEFGRDYAATVGKTLAQNRSDIAGLLDGEIYRKRRAESLKVFSSSAIGVVAKRSVRESDSTKEWLISTALPSLVRYMNSHDSDPVVRDMFATAIGRANW